MTPTASSLKNIEFHAVSGRTLLEPFRTWNETATDYPRDKTVAELFEEVAAACPESIAVVFGGQQLTYAELNQRANRLAHRLRRMGVGAETMVGCCIERSLELIVACIGVLKAGGAYVPLDPSYPKERLDFLIDDTRTPVMLTQKSLASTALAGRELPTVCVDGAETAVFESDGLNPSRAGGPRSLAYVMYTSGSTGWPKGAMVENRAIVRLVRNTTFCRFGADEVFLQFAPISFDASTLELWGPLLNGGRLVVMPPQASSLEELGRAIREQGVTTLWLTAGIFNLMVEQRLEDLRPVRQLLAGGDVLSPRHVRMVLENLPNCRLINGYGPTENTTFTCCHTMHPGDRVPESIPIGRPISNTQVYILDEHLRPAPPGQTGEIYAGGDGVARGYLNNPDATSGKFLPDPFAKEPGERMYRTGDLARWREDGIVEFLGRIDTQVKILGHRIEPGEVETVLRMHKGVNQICVVPHTDDNGSKRLVAYYVPSENPGISPRDLREFLRGKLPQYMVPALFVPMTSMPLSPNGKVDRAAMPKPAFAPEIDASTERPATHLERTIRDLWTRILRVDRVGLDDNFFDAGGDSLLLVAVHSNLQKALQLQIPVTDLFEFTTIRTLAKHLSEKKSFAPSFSQIQQQAQKQRKAFALERERRAGGAL
ncbi:MAG TPA: non-ribosomal peptide synthetase [Terriglobia bacterium]|nr:non-ribosomal peptide synthetase [Terriglobia bacterium]